MATASAANSDRNDPRQKYIEAALPLFAATGFHGTSIAQVATALGLTKQAMLHHFGSKEKLYGAVLGRVAERYEAMLDADEITQHPPAAQLDAAFEVLGREMYRRPDETKLLIRELMENSQRAQRAGTWYLRAFLTRLAEMAQDAPHWRGAPEREARAGIYMLLGMLNYLAISRPTLASMFGEDVPGDMECMFRVEISALIHSPRRPPLR